MNDKIIAVVVTYQPDLNVLKRLLMSVVPQVNAVVIVDNDSETYFPTLNLAGVDPEKISFIRLIENKGVAAAQNRGIAEAIQKRAGYVLLLDHDSIPAPDMVEKLLLAWKQLRHVGEKVAAVGPRYRFPNTNYFSYFVRFGLLRFQKIYCPDENGNPYISADFLISSGCLISLSSIADIGLMDEALFIDHVDTDWFLRAKAKGYSSYGVFEAEMDHSLGDSLFNFGLHKKRMLPVHHPLRLYYIFRNSFLLYQRPHAPQKWRVNDLVRLTLMFIFFSTRIRPRREYLRMMTRGIYDGVRGLSGRYQV